MYMFVHFCLQLYFLPPDCFFLYVCAEIRPADFLPYIDTDNSSDVICHDFTNDVVCQPGEYSSITWF